jgi:hypothetical protein
MALLRAISNSYIDALTISSGVAFPPSDAIIVRTSGSPVIILKSGATITLTSVAANTILPICAVSITDGVGAYSALYR